MSEFQGKEQLFRLEEDGLTASFLSIWLECRKKARLRMMGWVPWKVNKPFMFGSLFHGVLEFIHKKPDISRNDILSTLDKVEQEYRRNTRAETWSQNTLEEFELMTAKAAAILPEYAEWWMKADKKKKWVATELEFDIPFHTTRIRGKIDGVYEVGKKLWIKESKSSSVIIEDNLIGTLSLDLQSNIYCWAAEKILGKKPVGSLRDVMRRPGQKLLDRESISQHEHRVSVDVKKKPEHYFHRFEVAFDPSHQATFAHEFKEIVDEFLDWYSGRKVVTKFGMPCLSKYGLCSMVPICHEDDYSGHFVERMHPELALKNTSRPTKLSRNKKSKL